MTKHLVRSIEVLKEQVLTLGHVVEKSVENAVRAALTYDTELAKTVIEEDAKIDSMEVDVEEECLKILALHQPVASDLRFIVAILKMNNDLERIGDLAVNIAWRAIDLVKEPRSELLFDISGMAKESRSMLENSLKALVEMNPETARSVLRSDDLVDDMNRNNHAKVIDRLNDKSSASAKGLLLLLSISKNLERIADHATNIAEDVIYTAAGTIVRHAHDY